MKSSLRPFAVGLTLTFASVLAWAGSLNKTVYDFDDTLMSTTAYVQIFKKAGATQAADLQSSADVLRISTADWAEVRNMLGKEGPYANYELNKDLSFANFSGAPGTNAFLGHIKESLSTKSASDWKAPMWDDFARNLSDSKTAMDVYILTARSSTAAQVLEGFQYLKEQGHLQFVMPGENIFAVSDPALRLKSDPTKVLALEKSEVSKALVMQDMLDQLEADAKSYAIGSLAAGNSGAPLATGSLSSPLATWAFYDDDYANFAKARDTLIPQASQRWPHVQLTVGYVGNRRENTPIHEIVVRPFTQMPRIKKAAGQ